MQEVEALVKFVAHAVKVESLREDLDNLEEFLRCYLVSTLFDKQLRKLERVQCFTQELRKSNILFSFAEADDFCDTLSQKVFSMPDSRLPKMRRDCTRTHSVQISGRFGSTRYALLANGC